MNQSALAGAGLPTDELERLAAAREASAGRPSFEAAAERLSSYLECGAGLLARLPARPTRTEAEQAAAAALMTEARGARADFLRRNVRPLYDRLTDRGRRFLRVEELAYAAAELVPGLTPDRATVERELSVPLREKEGHEIDQGLLVSAVLSDRRRGAHLVHAMLRPTEAALERLPEFRRSGEADLGRAHVRREGKAGIVELRNPERLNAEDDSTNGPLETAIDLVILDPGCEVGVLRGGVVEHPKYAGRHVFDAGLNLTHLYFGRLSFLFYLTRDLGLVNKLYRGLTDDDFRPGGPERTLEKPWIGAVECFAIGGGCQILLVLDLVLAEEGSFFNLPARKEGIIPGAANLRLTRFVGDRLARQGVLYDRQFPADSPEGRLLCDELVPVGQMDAAIGRAVEGLTGSGIVSAAGNRKALRVGQEPLEQFQAYMALYAREQAYCHFSPALIGNLERHWDARNRRL